MRRSGLGVRGRQPRVPRGYRPGALLDRLEVDLRPLVTKRAGALVVHVSPPAGSVFLVTERVHRSFGSHVVSAVFTADLAGRSGHGRIALHHQGAPHGEGLGGSVKSGDTTTGELLRSIAGDPALEAAARALDFTRLDLVQSSEGWRVEIELVGASEVVVMVPGSRRYARLIPAQRDGLVATLAGLRQHLSGPT